MAAEIRVSGRRSASSDGNTRWGDRSGFDEAFRILRSNIEVALADIDRPAVIVTSAESGEGKSLTCAHLAMSFAAAGRRVVLVDLDLRHPDAHLLIGAHNEFGVSEVLLGQRTLDESIQYVELPGPLGRDRPGLYFLATGHQVSNPAELLGSGRTSRLLEGIAGQADLVMLDTPPVLPVADTLVIGRIASGAVLVTEARRTNVAAVQKAKDLLIRNQTRLLGVVLNKFQQRDAYFGYGYGYGYGVTGDETLPDEDPRAPSEEMSTPSSAGPTPNGVGREAESDR